MNKKILKQVLLFENSNPTYSKIKDLCEDVFEYQNENNIYFLEFKRGQKSYIKNEKLFFEFLSQTQELHVKKFQDIKDTLNASTRAENIAFSGSSKSNMSKVFSQVLIVKKIDEVIKMYKVHELSMLNDIESFVAVENGESFLNIEKVAKYFDSAYFIYLGGYSNTLTREFLKSKNIEFFVDYDIEGMNIYESFTCKSKKLHVAQSLEEYFSNNKILNIELYKKQVSRLKKNYSPEAQGVIEIIKKYSGVIEQEIIYETH